MIAAGSAFWATAAPAIEWRTTLGGSDMPIRIGFLLYSLVPLGLILAKRGPVAAFHKAGAVSPETARKPTALGAEGDLDGPLKRGLLVAVGDGRYYVNVKLMRRQRRRFHILLACAMVAIGAVILWLWPPWGE
jgi:hypothetical protein